MRANEAMNMSDCAKANVLLRQGAKMNTHVQDVPNAMSGTNVTGAS